MLCCQAGIPHIYTIDSVKKGDEEDPDSRWETYIKKEERYQVVDLFLGRVHFPSSLEIRTILRLNIVVRKNKGLNCSEKNRMFFS